MPYITNGESGSSVRAKLNRMPGALVFNVETYGAVHDGSTDDTDAINEAGSLADASGGNVFFPNGLYVVKGDFNVTTNSILTLPQTLNYSGIPRTIGFIGESRGAFIDSGDYVGGVALDFRDAPTGSGTFPAAFAAAPFVSNASGFVAGSWNHTRVIWQDMAIILPSNPTFGALNLANSMQAGISGVWATTIPYESNTVEPTHSSFGFLMPQSQNEVLNYIRDSIVSGVDVGVMLADCANIDIGISYANHPIRMYSGGVHSVSGVATILFCPEWLDVQSGAARCSALDLSLKLEMALNSFWYSTTGGITNANIARGRVAYTIFDNNTGTSGGGIVTTNPHVTFTNLLSDPVTPPPTDWIAQYPFLSNLSDSTGTYNLTDHNTITFGADGAIFNGTNQYGSQGSINLRSGDATICGWFKANTIATVALAAQHSASDPSWEIYIGSDGSINAQVLGSVSHANMNSAAGVVSTGVKYFVCLTINSVSLVCSLQINNGTEITGSMTTARRTSSVAMTMGCNLDGAADAAAFFFDGELINWPMFNRVLSVSERTAIYGAGS